MTSSSVPNGTSQGDTSGIDHYRAEIVSLIRRNRISTTEVADCLDKTGAIPSVLPINDGLFAVGPVHVALAFRGSNWSLHKMIEDVPEGSIVLVLQHECDGLALFGDLVAKFLILYRQVEAVVAIGLVRDVPRLRREGWPVWSTGRSPVGCSNDPVDLNQVPAKVRDEVDLLQGAVAICDDSGVVVIPRANLNQAFWSRLIDIEEQEDTWYECIDRRKWSTFKTVCEKQYRTLEG